MTMSRPPTYALASDAELIRASAHDEAAFEALFDRHAVKLRHWLVAETNDLAVANDLLAETFARAWLASRRFRGDRDASGRAWLYGIAKNLVLHHHRRGRVERSARKRLEILAVPTDDGGLDSTLARIDAERLVPAANKALLALEHGQRLAIGYRVLGGLSYAEAAARLRCNPATVRTRVHRGLRSLRTAIGLEESNV